MTGLVRRAFAVYVDRMDQVPRPVLVDHGAAIAEGRVWVAGDPVVGVLHLDPGEDTMEIDIVAVDPPSQGRGTGGALVRFAEDRAVQAGCRAVTLRTNEVMHENQAWYARHGYVEVDRRGDQGYQRVFMRKPLP